MNFVPQMTVPVIAFLLPFVLPPFGRLHNKKVEEKRKERQEREGTTVDQRLRELCCGSYSSGGYFSFLLPFFFFLVYARAKPKDAITTGTSLCLELCSTDDRARDSVLASFRRARAYERK